ncbi:chorismate-binding protein [Gleimia sp. 6138-11-ORH1]|uniref:isochorismate synthase n=1 Tax=Gleimia sp. 6138-11-ORH1 TaxID=2973937 RepID=UPI00216845D7|nr:chorismate-binding protein [Gleimia sp. 6138-11-ORH1]MCS4484666.1 chorismate-binding protein [Gleimia sp. 6138-11-ORH1]
MQLHLRIRPLNLTADTDFSTVFSALLAASTPDPLLSAWHGPAVGETSQPTLVGSGAAVAAVLTPTEILTLRKPSHAGLQKLLQVLAETSSAVAADLSFPSPQFAAASEVWSQLNAAVTVSSDSVSLTEFVSLTGFKAPFAFFSFGFSPGTAAIIVIPERTLIATTTGMWEIEVLEVDEPPTGWAESFLSSEAATRKNPAQQAKISDSALTQSSPLSSPQFTYTDDSAADWEKSVTKLIARLRAKEAQKTVLARTVTVKSQRPLQPNWILAQLNEAYPTTWKFSVAGLVGATPEMLADIRAGQVFSRVLAGTCAPGNEAYLIASSKDLAEHKFAAESVIRALETKCTRLQVSPAPFVLRLPNVSHLATDVTGTIQNQATAGTLFEVLGSLHPTAAVCGTPTAAAFKLINELELSSRGRYAAPVGWIDGAGNGAGGLALRCGQIDASGLKISLYAGCGIMPDSDPAAEVAETRAKLRPLLHVFNL